LYLLQDGKSRQEIIDHLLVVFSMAGGTALVLSFGLAWLADWRVRKAIAFSADDKPQPTAEGTRTKVGDIFD
jgi:anaerobic C4-dicarboxylate transporter